MLSTQKAREAVQNERAQWQGETSRERREPCGLAQTQRLRSNPRKGRDAVACAQLRVRV